MYGFKHGLSTHSEYVGLLYDRGITCLSLHGLPRTISGYVFSQLLLLDCSGCRTWMRLSTGRGREDSFRHGESAFKDPNFRAQGVNQQLGPLPCRHPLGCILTHATWKKSHHCFWTSSAVFETSLDQPFPIRPSFHGSSCWLLWSNWGSCLNLS